MRAVFIDRDGTMAKDVHYCRRVEDFILFPHTAQAIKLLREHGFKVIVITNQSGIARGYFTEETLTQIHDKMKQELAKAGTEIDGIYHCPHHPDDNCNCRKPKPELVLRAAKDFGIDLRQSFMVGDLPADIELGRGVNCKTVLIGNSSSPESAGGLQPDGMAGDLLEAVQLILRWIR